MLKNKKYTENTNNSESKTKINNNLNKMSNINKILNNSNYKILNYKNDLHNLYKIILTYCNQNNIVISNNNLNISLINKYDYKLMDINNDFKFVLLSQNPKKDATNIVNELYNNYSKYVFLASYLNNREIIITIDNNKILQVNLLFSNYTILKEISGTDKFNFIKYDFTFDNNENFNNLTFLPNNIELLYLTHKLYHPTYFLKYIKNTDSINKDTKVTKVTETPISGFNIIDKYNYLINNLKSNIEGGKIIKKRPKINVKQLILSDFFNIITTTVLNDLKFILLDIHAITLLKLDRNETEHNLNFYNTLNFITNNNNTELNVGNVTKYIMEIFKDILKKNKITYDKIAYTVSTFYLHDDFRLKKINIFIIVNDKKISLINIFNSIDYELIPIVKKYNKLLIPHEIVIIRFLLINLLSLQLYDKNYNINYYNDFMSQIEICKNLDIKHNTIYYTGTFVDEKIDKFKYGSELYRPWQYFIKNNKLLELE